VLRIVRVLAPNPGVFELEGTNTWIVGPDPAIVIDPGPEHEGHFREVQRTAGRIGEILLTHDHPDHAPGALRLREMTGAPIRAARPVEGMEPLRDGEVVRSGLASLLVVATPGHSADHVAFFGSQDGALFTGDAVLGRGTSVIDPPEGDLVAYLRSLHRMRVLAPRTIYPGHGPVVLRAMAKLEEYVEHRAMRERQVLEALGGERRTPQELVADIYRDYPPRCTRPPRARCSRTCSSWSPRVWPRNGAGTAWSAGRGSSRGHANGAGGRSAAGPDSAGRAASPCSRSPASRAPRGRERRPRGPPGR
jgi:glyoxylase-like metal-dependent hydrolase (beta-lactamase superfamily II)